MAYRKRLERIVAAAVIACWALACAKAPEPKAPPPSASEPLSEKGAPPPRAPVHTAPPPEFGNRVVDKGGDVQIPKPRAVEIAREEAVKAGYALAEYELESTELDDGSYRVHFQLRPKGRPGGHFTVHVNAHTGSPQLIPGR